jgi:hypothetical protein
MCPTVARLADNYLVKEENPNPTIPLSLHQQATYRDQNLK